MYAMQGAKVMARHKTNESAPVTVAGVRWPPKTGYRDPTTPRRLRTWRFTWDGAFWGAVFFVMAGAASIIVIASAIYTGQQGK